MCMSSVLVTSCCAILLIPNMKEYLEGSSLPFYRSLRDNNSG